MRLAAELRAPLMAAALRAARSNRLNISAEFCVAHLEAWRHDRVRRRHFVERLPQAVLAEQALGVLGPRI